MKVDIERAENQILTLNIGPGELENTRGIFSATINPFLKFKKLKDGSESNDDLLLVYQTEENHH